MIRRNRLPFQILPMILAIVSPPDNFPPPTSENPRTTGLAIPGQTAAHRRPRARLPDRPAFQAMLERLNLKLINILVMDDTLPYRKDLQPQVDDASNLVRSSKGHVALCTTFDPYKFNDPSFPKEAIQQIERDFKDGAIAVKIWKNIGMEIRTLMANTSCPTMRNLPRSTPPFKKPARP